MAYELGVEKGSLKLGGHLVPIDSRVTNIYRQESGEWKLVHHHSDVSAAMVEAVEQLMARQRRRSLVILLTNLRGEDGRELIPALQVLKSRHLVLLASMRERAVEDALTVPVGSFSSALKYLAADRYQLERREILATLGALGVLTLDSTAPEFAVALANSYHDIKAAGRI